jgi:hypothetical protein
MRSSTERTYACAVTPLLAKRYWQLYLAYSWKGPIPFAFQAPRPRPIGRFAPDSSVHTHGSQFSAADGPSSSRHFRAEPVLRPRIPASQHDREERLPVSPLARRIASVRATRIDCNQAAVGQFAGRTDLISQYRSRAAPADRLLYITVRKNSDRRRHILRPDRRHGLPPALACDRISPDATLLELSLLRNAQILLALQCRLRKEFMTIGKVPAPYTPLQKTIPTPPKGDPRSAIPSPSIGGVLAPNQRVLEWDQISKVGKIDQIPCCELSTSAATFPNKGLMLHRCCGDRPAEK